jgi:serine protease Do
MESADLSNLIARTRPGKSTRLGVWRSGKQKELDIRVEELRDTAASANVAPPPQADESATLGLAVRPLTREEKRSVETTGDVVVIDVAGAARRAGIEPGDIILAVNSREVRSVNDLRSASEELEAGDAAALLVERGGAQIYVPVRISGADRKSAAR